MKKPKRIVKAEAKKGGAVNEKEEVRVRQRQSVADHNTDRGKVDK